MSIRTERVAGEIKKSLSEILQNEYSHLYDALVTITVVRLSGDLRHCKVYLSMIPRKDMPEDILKRIKAETPHIRSSLAHSIRIRHVPELLFYLDDTQEEVQKMEYLFKEIHRREQEQRDTN